MAHLEPCFPKFHNKPCVGDRRVLSRAVICVNRYGLRWCDAPGANGPHKTPHNFRNWWGDKGVFTWIMASLAGEHSEEKIVMIDATYLKVHRMAFSLG